MNGWVTNLVAQTGNYAGRNEISITDADSFWVDAYFEETQLAFMHEGDPAEIKLMSCVTLKDLISPFDVVDYLESDIQQSEIVVFPPFIDLLRRKVRRILIGTHGIDAHHSLHQLFADQGWEIVFSFEPNATHNSALGQFVTNDGILTVRNPDL